MFARFLFSSLLFLSTIQAVTAGEIVIGMGADDILDSNRDHANGAFAGLVELHLEPFARVAGFDLAPMATLQFDNHGDYYAGIGFYVFRRLGRARRWMIEASLAGGILRERSTRFDIDDDFRFRSSIGFGFDISPRARMSLTLDHILDESLRNQDPGSETIFIRYTRKY